MSASKLADLDRIEDVLINVEGAALLLNLVVTHGDHLGADRATAVWQVNRLMAADVAEMRSVYNYVFHAQGTRKAGAA